MAKIVITKPAEEDLKELGVENWPIWTCGVSKFEWHYDQKETCYILAGQVSVTAGDDEVCFGPGDMVIFPRGLDCVWDVAMPVRKHYKLD